MKSKKHIYVFGNKVNIRRLDLSKHGIYGCFNAVTNEILIDKDLKGDKLSDTLCHEIFHAIAHYGGCRQANLSHDLEEILAEQTANTFTKLFKLDFR